jgi:hypothetical protein
MRKFVLSSAFGVAMIALAASGASAQAGATAKPAEKTASKPAVAGHATQGVVKSVDASSLVISRGKKADETFMLNASTQRQGTIEPGAQVSVHYREEGKSHVATAIVAKPMKKVAAKK